MTLVIIKVIYLEIAFTTLPHNRVGATALLAFINAVTLN